MRELVVSGCYTSEILEPAKAALDDVSAFIGLLVITDFLFAVGFAWDHGLDAALFEKGPDRVSVIALVGKKFFDAGDEAHAFFGHHAIGGVAGSKDERPGSAEFVDERIDLAVAAPFRKPDRLKFGPPFPP